MYLQCIMYSTNIGILIANQLSYTFQYHHIVIIYVHVHVVCDKILSLS